MNLHSELLAAQSQHVKRPFGRRHNSSVTSNLAENIMKLADAKISPVGTLQEVKCQNGAAKFTREHFQAICLQMIMQNYFPVYDPVVRLRQKLERWKLEGPPRLIAERALPNLNRLAKVAPQRLVASALRAIFNGEVTKRRMCTLTGSSESACALVVGSAATVSNTTPSAKCSRSFADHYGRMELFLAEPLCHISFWLPRA